LGLKRQRELLPGRSHRRIPTQKSEVKEQLSTMRPSLIRKKRLILRRSLENGAVFLLLQIIELLADERKDSTRRKKGGGLETTRSLTGGGDEVGEGDRRAGSQRRIENVTEKKGGSLVFHKPQKKKELSTREGGSNRR